MNAVTEPIEQRPEPAERGRVEISRQVLRKIAEYAADQVPGTVRVRRRSGIGEHGASARLSGPDQELRVHLDLALRYPDPIQETVAAVRERVTSELHRLADCQVHAVDVTVSALLEVRTSRRVE